MEILHLGKTEIPSDVVEEYIGSLTEIYTPEVLIFSCCIQREKLT